MSDAKKFEKQLYDFDSDDFHNDFNVTPGNPSETKNIEKLPVSVMNIENGNTISMSAAMV